MVEPEYKYLFTCPRCRSGEGCDHLARVIDVTFVTATGGDDLCFSDDVLACIGKGIERHGNPVRSPTSRRNIA
jgi:hypothetical protein